MPSLTQDEIQSIVSQLLESAGAPSHHAETVAIHLADANLAGHDSHGFIRIIQYMGDIEEGRIDPKPHPKIARDSKATARVNGNGTFGQVVGAFATRLAMKKAREYGIGLVTLHNMAHTGRIGTYPEMVAREGMAAIMYDCGIGSTGHQVAPFGGREGRLGTNPVSMSFPASADKVVLLDFATSMAAEGKLRVYRARGDQLPEEWVLNKDGVPSRDPNDYYDGGAILPLGGLSGGHKGYALSFMVVLFGAVLGALGADEDGVLDSSRGASSIVVVDLEGIAPLDGVRAQVEELTQYMKSSPLMEGSRGVLYPGEIEANTREERLKNGVQIEQSTWDQVVQLIKDHGLEQELQAVL